MQEVADREGKLAKKNPLHSEMVVVEEAKDSVEPFQGRQKAADLKALAGVKVDHGANDQDDQVEDDEDGTEARLLAQEKNKWR